MNFNELKDIVQEIVETFDCRACSAHFRENNVHIIGTVFNEAFFLAKCSDCKNGLIVNVIFRKSKNRKHRKLVAKKKKDMKIISNDDVLDFHNFLKEFDGDFINLFGKK